MEMIPKELKEMLQKQYGEELTNQIIRGYSSKRKTTLRINPLKTSKESIEEIFRLENITHKEISWYSDAFVIENVKEDILEQLPCYQKGEIYLQSLSSMLPVLVLNPKEQNHILDMAAAPGGKTMQIAALTRNKALITACEKNKIRAQRLTYNIQKQGVKNVTVLTKDAYLLDDFFTFDTILLDTPCSGSGTVLLDEEKTITFTKDFVDQLSKIQIKLLKKAVRLLKKGGEMVYSTCSILEEENEKIIEEILKEGQVEIVPIDLKPYLKIPFLPSKIEGTICVCPSEYYEGFFVAKLRKK